MDDVGMQSDTIQLGHGGGGLLSRDLIRDEILSRFGDDALRGLPDGATLPMPRGRALVFSTDSYVVQPLEFPGGTIGDLAVHGTVNDLAVCGARPRWLSLGLILEEGLDLAVLRRVLDSVMRAAADCGVAVVTGDTKVVARGQCDGLYVNTAGIGELLEGFALEAGRVRPGDQVLVSGPLGDHGMAVLAARQGIRITNGPCSDTGPVHRLVAAIQPLAPGVRFMRDPTRGGLAAALNEIVEQRPAGILLRETALPFAPGTRAAAEMLGLDLLQVACEGRLLAICAPDIADRVLAAWRTLPEGRAAARVGEVTGQAGRVLLETVTGGRRLVDVPRGELLPRIC
jgi:hydrogenase expression/formation protein HypE